MKNSCKIKCLKIPQIIELFFPIIKKKCWHFLKRLKHFKINFKNLRAHEIYNLKKKISINHSDSNKILI